MPATAKKTVPNIEGGGIVADNFEGIASDQGKPEPLGKHQYRTTISEKRPRLVVTNPSIHHKSTTPKAPSFVPVEFPYVRQRLPGIPSTEDDPGVLAARTWFTSINNQYLEARKARLAAAKALGLNADAGYSERDLEIVAGKLLAKDKGTDAIDQLEALTKTESRLRIAAELAAKEIGPALELALGECSAQLLTDGTLPAKRKVVLAWIELIKADRDHHTLVNAAGYSGFYLGLGNCEFFEAAPLAQSGRVQSILSKMVSDGIVSAEEASGII